MSTIPVARYTAFRSKRIILAALYDEIGARSRSIVKPFILSNVPSDGFRYFYSNRYYYRSVFDVRNARARRPMFNVPSRCRLRVYRFNGTQLPLFFIAIHRHVDSSRRVTVQRCACNEYAAPVVKRLGENRKKCSNDTVGLVIMYTI